MAAADARSSDSNAPRVGVSVLLPLPLAGAYDYRADPALGLQPGDFVAVPLGNREVIGVVWGAASGEVAEAKLRDVAARLESPPLPVVICQFVDWVANYTLSPPGAVLRMAMSVPVALEPPKPIAAWQLDEVPAEGGGIRLTAERRRVLAVLAEGPPRMTADLARQAGVSTGVVKSLAEIGAIKSVSLPRPSPFGRPNGEREGPQLNEAQAAAAQALMDQVTASGFGVTALDGVTGAGKTEVYFEAIAQALRGGRQALVLLPEIALGAVPAFCRTGRHRGR